MTMNWKYKSSQRWAIHVKKSERLFFANRLRNHGVCRPFKVRISG